MRRSSCALFVVGAVVAWIAGCGQSLVEYARSDAGEGDLAGADLAGVDLSRVDLAGADLAGVDLASRDLATVVDFAGVDLTGVDLATGGDMTSPCSTLHLAGNDATVTTDGTTLYNPAGAFTIEGWVYETARGTTSSVVAAHWGDTASKTASYSLEIDPTGHAVFRFTTADVFGAETVHSVTSTQVVALDHWTHVAGQFSPGSQATYSVYVGGTSGGSATLTVVLNAVAVQGVPLSVGHYSSATTGDTDAFAGEIHDVRLSAVTRYPSGMAPAVRLDADAHTTALYRFNETSGTSAADQSSNGVTATLIDNARFATATVCP